MGRAIVRDPKAFLMDEPLSNLDAKLRVQMRTEVSRLQKRLGTTTVYVTHDQTEAMTLGDRVVVMRGGVVQQVGTPDELYVHPVNLFVAGFIGSPAMNFLAATVDGDQLRTPLGTVPMTDVQQRAVGDHGLTGDAIVGLRPEHFEDLALVHDKREDGGTYTASVDVVESMGSDAYVYFDVAGSAVSSADLEQESGDQTPGASEQVIARLDPQTSARENQSLQLWFDVRRMHIFDPDSGRNITATSGDASALTA
jgi:multiple sugar transport system ATP-binding protein